MNITLRNVPEDVHARLKKRAKANGRSLNNEAVSILASGSSGHTQNRAAFLAKLDRDRKKMGVYVKQSDLEKIIHEGRR